MPRALCRGDNPRRQEEQQLGAVHARRITLEQVADDWDAAQDWHLRDVDLRRSDDHAADDDRRAVRNRNLALGRFGVQRRNALNARDTLIDLGIFDDYVHEYGAIRGDLRGDNELEHGVNVLHRNRVVDRRLNRNLHTLLDRGLFVVLGHDARLRQQFADALGFRGGDEEVEREVRRTSREAEAAGRHACAEVDVQRDTGGGAVAGGLAGADHNRRRGNTRASGHAAAADRRRSAEERAAASGRAGEAELGTDVLGEGAGSGDNASFDFNLLRFAVELVEQVIDIRNDRRNVADDELVRARVEQDVSAGGQKFLQRRRQRFRLRVVEHAGHGRQFLRIVFRLADVAGGLGFLLDGVERSDAEHVAVELLLKSVVLENDVESLVPGYFVENDRQRALDVGIEHDVQAADFVDQAEEVAQIDVFQVYRDRLTAVAAGHGLRCNGCGCVSGLSGCLSRRFLRGDGTNRFIFLPAERCEDD